MGFIAILQNTTGNLVFSIEERELLYTLQMCAHSLSGICFCDGEFSHKIRNRKIWGVHEGLEEDIMLELQNISYLVDDDNKEILRDINLAFDEKFVAITGPNGSGKSTLAKIIAGILKPTSGKILLDGEDITDLNITERAKKGISYAFQQPVKFKGLKVKDLMSVASGKTLDIKGICDILSEVGLCARDYINRELNGSLSGGELKRIEIAMIKARATKLSVFDEPEAGIDLWSFNSLIHVFEDLHEKTDGTILIISHQERILEIADRIIVINDGLVEKSGKGEEVIPELLYKSSMCQKLSRN